MGAKSIACAAFIILGNLYASCVNADATTSKAIPDWYVRGIGAAFLDTTQGIVPAIMRLPRIRDALGALAISDVTNADKIKIVESLMRHAEADDTNDWLPAVDALASINILSAEQRATLLVRLGKPIVGGNYNTHKARLEHLRAIASSDPSERRRVIEILLRKIRSGDQQTRRDSIGALSFVSPADDVQQKVVVDTLIDLVVRSESATQSAALTALQSLENNQSKYQIPIFAALIGLAQSGDTAQQQEFIKSASKIGSPDPKQRAEFIKTLLGMLIGGDERRRGTATDALAALRLSGPKESDDAIDALIKLSLSDIPSDQGNALFALASIKPSDERRRTLMVEVAVRLASSDDTVVRIFAADALGAIAPVLRHDELSVVAGALLHILTLQRDHTDNAQKSLHSIALTGSAQSRALVEAAVGSTKSRETNVRAAAIIALCAIATDEPALRNSIARTLIDLIKSDNSDTSYQAIRALALVAPVDPSDLQSAVRNLIDLTGSDDPDIQKEAVATLVAITPETSEFRKTAFDVISTNTSRFDFTKRDFISYALDAIGPSNTAQRVAYLKLQIRIIGGFLRPEVLPRFERRLREIASVDPDHRKEFVEVLLESVADRDPEGRGAAVYALRFITPADPAQEKEVTERLIKLLTDTVVQNSIFSTLTAINPTDPQQRKIVVEQLRKFATSTSVTRGRATAIHDSSLVGALSTILKLDDKQREYVNETMLSGMRRIPNWDGIELLLEAGPLEPSHILTLLAKINRDNEDTVAEWRAIAWALNGALPMKSDGAILLSFAGRAPTDVPAIWPKEPKDVLPVVRVFLNRWPNQDQAKSVRAELATRTISIVRAACPDTSTPINSGVLETGVARIGQEWHRTLSWLSEMLGGRDDLRCWRGGDLATLEKLRDRFSEADGLGAYRRELSDHLSADGVRPLLGQAVVSALGWALIWIAFVALFPHSVRIRSAYLFNDKARNWISLGFLPIVMTLFPLLRRRMLRPFQKELLADANLDNFETSQYFPKIMVLDRSRSIRHIDAAINDINGKILLIGESGLGKSTFLRLLAARSPGTVAYLNARATDKGVLAALVERVSGFESPEFFKSLVYSGDLAIIIDGFNEVNADVRAGIVAFMNAPGNPNIIIATQPILGIGTHNSPFARVTAFEMLPLARDDISEFLKTRPARNDPHGVVRGDSYDQKVNQLLHEALDRSQTDALPEEHHTAELILSNPMDLTYCSEMIGRGLLPKPSHMIEQAFRQACGQYRKIFEREFPALEFARKGVSIRLEGRNYLKDDEFASEQGVLAEYRLLVPQTQNETMHKQSLVMRFRHDKVMDVLTKKALETDTDLQVKLVGDPRFRGIYLLFAQAADRELARKIRDLLVSSAAKTGENGLSNEFVRLFDRVPEDLNKSTGTSISANATTLEELRAD